VTHRGRWPGWWRQAFLCSVALGVLSAGCAVAGPGSTVAGASTTTTTSAPAVTYVAVAGRSISFGMTQSPSGCNPHTTAGDTPATQLVLNAVLPSAFTLGANGKVSGNPNLLVQSHAEVVSTKPLTIVYVLNPKAVWSDGVPITAKDFIYAWTQQRGDPTSDPTSVASTAGYRDIKSVKGSNKGRTVTVVFRTPFADWEMLFSDLLPAHIMEKTGWNPACKTVDPAIDLSGGPFRIAKVTAQSVVLRSNPRWFGTKPNARRITVDIAADPTQLAQWVRTNKVQVALPGELTPAFLDQMTSLPGVQSQIALSGTILQMEMASGPDSRLTSDVRLAIALSVDRQALTTRQANWAISSVQVAASHIYAQGQSGYQSTPSTTPTTTPPTPTTSTSTSTTMVGQGGSVNFPVTPSPTQASDLMIDSGYSRAGTGTWHNAFAVPLTLKLAVDEGDPWAASAAPQLQSQLQSAGFSVSLTPEASAAAAGELLSAGTVDVALVPHTSTPFLSETMAWYSNLLGPPGQNGSQNWTNYDDHTFNSLVTKASQQLSTSAAAADYQAADVQLWDDSVALPLFTEPTALISSRKIAQVTPTPTNNSLLWYAQYWAVKVPESTNNTTPSLPGP
jgi:peptide/nickel transport system substrate-binding protein